MSQNTIKMLVLCTLTVQNTVHIIAMRHSRSRFPADQLYLNTSAVVISELVKFLISLYMLLKQYKPAQIFAELRKDPVDSLKIAVPALIYVVQNNLLYIALGNLDSATFQVSYQLKLLTTAVCSVVLLKKVISGKQWLSLLVLFVGVALVQLEKTAPSAATSSSAGSWSVGMCAVLAASLLSGLAGVYFEKVLKGSTQSIWLRNTNLALIGIVIGVCGQLVSPSDLAVIRDPQRGYFHGFDWLVWLVIALHSIGGLLVGMVVKYADNILKGFACSAAIVLSILLSVFVFGQSFSVMFIAGAGFVAISIVFYAKFPPKPIQQKQH